MQKQSDHRPLKVCGISPLDPLWLAGLFMRMANVIKDTRFELVTEIQKTDAKKRLSLGQAVEAAGAAYNIYRNPLGQIVLDPVKAVPAYETWLFHNKKRSLPSNGAWRIRPRGRPRISAPSPPAVESDYKGRNKWFG
jgi:hypothetical protein